MAGVFSGTWVHAASGAVLIWVACADTGALVASEPELLLGSVSGSVVLQQLGSVVMSMVHVSTGVTGTMLC